MLLTLNGCAEQVVVPQPVPPPVEPAARVDPPVPRPAPKARNDDRDRHRAARAEASRRAAAQARADAAAVERQVAKRSRHANGLELRLQQHFDDWLGVPYRYGGMSRSGIDCSGFVALTFRTQLGIDLPRTTAAQVKEGKSVAVKRLQTGDLVFFRPERNRRHVGIYLSDGEFIHSATTQGVSKSSLDNPYWAKRFWQARRVNRR